MTSTFAIIVLYLENASQAVVNDIKLCAHVSYLEIATQAVVNDINLYEHNVLFRNCIIGRR